MNAAMPSSAAFQQAFARALLADDPSDEAPAWMRALIAQPGFAVYRNTVICGCVDALRANYPAVATLVGDDWFDAAATHHARATPPSTPVLLDYGRGFADFLAGFPPAMELPWLADVARLDRFHTEAHAAPDARPTDPAAVAALGAAALSRVVLRPHPSARWAWFDDSPAAAIWQRSRAGQDLSELDWQPDGMLVVRPRDRVDAVPLGRAACVLLDGCAAGLPLAEAALVALEADRNADLRGVIAALLSAGAFVQGVDDDRRGESE